MTGRTLSEWVKKLKEGKTQEKKMKEALNAWQHNVLKPEDLRKSEREIAKEFEVPYCSSNRHVHGGQSIRDFNKTKQKLTPG
jgi:hypothetical protein